MAAPWAAIVQHGIGDVTGRSELAKEQGGGAGEYAKAYLNPLPIWATRMFKKKKGDEALPGREDPEERAALNYTKRQRRAFQTGTAMKANRDALASMMQSGMSKSIAAGGGTRGLNMMQSMFNQAMLGLGQQGQDKALQYSQQAQQQLTRISQRKLELGMLKYNTIQAREAQKEQDRKEKKNTGMAQILGSMGGGKSSGGDGGGGGDATGGAASSGGGGATM